MQPLGLTPEIIAKAIPQNPEFFPAVAEIRDILLADEESFISILLALASDRHSGLSSGYFWRAQAEQEIREERHRLYKWLDGSRRCQ